MELKDYQIEIIDRALSLLVSNYDEYDLDELMYSGLELEAEITSLRQQISFHLKESDTSVNS